MQTDCSSIQREHLLKAPRALTVIFLGVVKSFILPPFEFQRLTPTRTTSRSLEAVGLSATTGFLFSLFHFVWPCNYLGSWTFVLGPCKYLETTGWPCWWRTWRTGASTRWRRSTTPRRRSPRSLYKIPSGRNLSELQQIWYWSGMPLQLAHSTLMALGLPQLGCGVKPTEIYRRFIFSFLL